MLPSTALPDWPLPCDVCGQNNPLHAAAVTHRPLTGAEDMFPGVRFNVVHCPDRWACRAWAAMPGPWRGRPVPAIGGRR